MTDEIPLREALLASAKEGHLLQAVYANATVAREERDDIARELATLHNQGLVNVVAAFEALKNNAVGGPDFFLTRHVFEKALPHLDAPVATVMRCVLLLSREAGQDLAAGTIFESYIEFCTKHVARPREALKLIAAEPDVLGDMLASTIAAGSRLDNSYYLNELLRLIHHHDIELRRRAVFAVARINWPKGGSVPDNAITALEKVVTAETDDRIFGGAIRSAFSLFEQDKTLEERIVALIGTALARGDEFTLHAASELLWFNTNTLPPSLLQLLLTHLKKVKPVNVGTVNNIDLGLADLLKRDDPEEGILFLEELLLAHIDSLKAEILASTLSAIREDPKLVSKVLTRWFLRGERTLCEAAKEVAGRSYGSDFRIDIDVSEIKPADHAHVLFVARKAIGYFFMQPVTSASIVVSLMRLAPDDETLNPLGDLLFDPLLLNYPGDTRDYLVEQAGHESGKVKETIANALAALDQYLEVLRTIPELPALYPGQSQRESYRRHMSGLMAESMKAAEKKSIFVANLFSRSTLLYGNKSINYIYAGDDEPHRMKIPLASHSVSMQFPRLDNIDPFGLNFMLRIFRAERLPS